MRIPPCEGPLVRPPRGEVERPRPLRGPHPHLARYLCGWVIGAGWVMGGGTQKPIMHVLGARQSTLLWHGKAHLPYATLQ
jgi:hypothetical protein